MGRRSSNIQHRLAREGIALLSHQHTPHFSLLTPTFGSRKKKCYASIFMQLRKSWKFSVSHLPSMQSGPDHRFKIFQLKSGFFIYLQIYITFYSLLNIILTIKSIIFGEI